jgi:hypothetical protein
MGIKPVLILASVLILIVFMDAPARQKPAGRRGNEPAAAQAAMDDGAAPADLARIAIASQGGDKFRNLKSVFLLGSVELYFRDPSRSISGQFAIVEAGERYRSDVQTPAFSYQEIYDGKRAYSSVDPSGFPPPSKFGLAVLSRFDRNGYAVSALPDKKQQRGFRITDSEGNSTDFYADRTTGRIMEYSFGYEGVNIVTEQKAFKEVEGVLVAQRFLQKISAGKRSFYVDFKVKEAKINQPVNDNVFIIPSR